MSDAVEEVKARLSIETIVGEHVELKRSGAGFKGLCPFHGEKTPSFYVSPARGTFHCFGCGQGGDILTFVQNIDKVDFREALGKLAGRAGVELPDDSARREQASVNDRLYAANASAAEFFRDQLKSGPGKRATAYLADRKLPPGIQHIFGLGFAPQSRTALLEDLSKRGFTHSEIQKAGLIIVPEDGQSKDRFHGRVMFPIRDRRGRVTGFGARSLDGSEPKYLNSPQTDLFDKSQTLFALDQAQESIRTTGRAVVVEGYIDAIRAHASGFKEVVASLGTAITPAQLQMCSRLASTVILALDPDPAGQEAAARTALRALAALPRRQQQLPDSLGRRLVDIGLTVDLRIARIPPGEGDPDELIERDPERWQSVLAASIPAFEFYFETVTRLVDRNSETWRQQILDRILPVIQEFPFALGMQAAWIERLSDLTGIQSRLLQSRLASGSHLQSSERRKASGPDRAPPKPVPVPLSLDPKAAAEQSLVQVLLHQPIPGELLDALSGVHPSDRNVGALLKLIIEQAGSSRRPDISRAEPSLRQLADELLRAPLDELSEGRIVPAIRLHIARIRLCEVKRRQDDLQAVLPELTPDDQPSGKRQLGLILDEIRDLEKQIDDLNHRVVAGS